MTTYEEILSRSKKYAEEKNIKLNPNQAIVRGVINGLIRNEAKFGELYCPCRTITGNKKEDSKKICPCWWSMSEIEETGHCLCNLFVRKEAKRK